MSQLKEEFLSSTTKDKQRFIDAWTSHVNQLSSLGLALIDASDGTEYFDELQVMQQRLNELVQIAADEDFKYE